MGKRIVRPYGAHYKGTDQLYEEILLKKEVIDSSLEGKAHHVDITGGPSKHFNTSLWNQNKEHKSDVEVSLSDFSLVQINDCDALTFLKGILSDVITEVQKLLLKIRFAKVYNAVKLNLIKYQFN